MGRVIDLSVSKQKEYEARSIEQLTEHDRTRISLAIERCYIEETCHKANRILFDLFRLTLFFCCFALELFLMMS